MTTALSSAEKGLLLVELIEAGIAMMKLKLHRKYQGTDPVAEKCELDEWLYRKHDKIPGDVSGPSIRIRNKAG
jgi:hypothetical protein